MLRQTVDNRAPLLLFPCFSLLLWRFLSSQLFGSIIRVHSATQQETADTYAPAPTGTWICDHSFQNYARLCMRRSHCDCAWVNIVFCTTNLSSFHHHHHHWLDSPTWALAFLRSFCQLSVRLLLLQISWQESFPGWGCQPNAQPPAILEGRCFLSGLSPLAD
jgi:hypothetical protein